MAPVQDWKFDGTDRACLDYLKDFIPDKIIDAHTHPFKKKFIQAYLDSCESVFSQFPYDELGYEKARQLQESIYGPLKDYRILGLPMPDFPQINRENGLRDEYAAWMAAEADRNPGKMAGTVLVMPGDTEDDIEALLRLSPGLVGLKCYQWFAPRLSEATMDEFLPDSAWKVAERRGLPIIVHLARPKTIADGDNLAQVLQKTRAYPNAKLILAHCGTSFTGHLLGDVIDALKQRDNIWLDLAAVCEPSVMFEGIKGLGPSRVLWGTDFPISMGKGRCVSLGAGFLWMSQYNLRGLAEQEATGGVALYVVEELMAFYQACRMLELPVADREKIFYDNAKELFFPE